MRHIQLGVRIPVWVGWSHWRKWWRHCLSPCCVAFPPPRGSVGGGVGPDWVSPEEGEGGRRGGGGEGIGVEFGGLVVVILGVGSPCLDLLVRSGACLWWLGGPQNHGPEVCPLGSSVPVGCWCWAVGSRFPCSQRQVPRQSQRSPSRS